jgi:TP901 family phage tail tape measure protein
MNRDLTNQMASRIQSITLDFNKLRNIPPAIANEIAGLNKQFADTKGTTELESKITKYNTLNDTIKKLRAEYQSLNKQENDAMLGQRTGNSQSSFAAWLNNNSKAYKKFGDEIKELQNRFKDVKSLGELKQLNADIDSFKLKVGQAGQLGRSMFDSLKTAAAKFGSWLVASGGVMFLVQGLRQMVQTVKELDQQLVNLQMATGATRQETAKLLQTYNQMGQELGFATGEIASAANSFLRQGKTIEQTNTLVKDSLILSRVGMLDTATATQYLTSAMKGYKVSVNDVIGIIDKLSAVDLQSATDAGGLALAMQDVANIANMVGISKDRLIGYLATTGEVTQDSMDSIGTSYKTILTRMQNVKLGKFLDDEGEQISNVESILNSVGIKLRSDNQTWRNFGDVLDEVGGKWSTYSSVQKSAIANAFAGKLALCSNM